MRGLVSLLAAAMFGALVWSCSDDSPPAPEDTCGAPITLTPPNRCDAPAFDVDAMLADVKFLAAPELCGRVPGTPGDEAARALIADRFGCLGITIPGGLSSYEQPFKDSAGNATANVLGVVPGTDGTVGNEIILVSAHSDHLGDGRLGANDNASGVAGLLAIAQALHESSAPSRRTVVFAVFNVEEGLPVADPKTGLEGSQYFLENPPSGLDVDKIVYVVNMDMIGKYTATHTVEMLGALDGTYAKTSLEGLATAFPDLQVSTGSASDLSDNATFCRRGVPYVFAWTQDDECYHQTCDTAERIDGPEMAQIAKLVSQLVADLANTQTDLAADVKLGTDVCGL